MIGDMQQPGPRGRPSSSGAARSRAREQPADDWLGDISDYDWSEHAAEHDERDDATTSREGLVAVADDTGRPTSGAVDAAEARRAVVERRRIVAGLVIAAVLGVVIVVALVLLRGGSETAVTPPATTTTPATTTPSTTTTTTTPTATQETPTQQTPNTTPSTTTPATGASSFTLPEGTKLRLGEGDPGLVRQLQAVPGHRRVRPRFRRRHLWARHGGGRDRVPAGQRPLRRRRRRPRDGGRAEQRHRCRLIGNGEVVYARVGLESATGRTARAATARLALELWPRVVRPGERRPSLRDPVRERDPVVHGLGLGPFTLHRLERGETSLETASVRLELPQPGLGRRGSGEEQLQEEDGASGLGRFGVVVEPRTESRPSANATELMRSSTSRDKAILRYTAAGHGSSILSVPSAHSYVLAFLTR